MIQRPAESSCSGNTMSVLVLNNGCVRYAKSVGTEVLPLPSLDRAVAGRVMDIASRLTMAGVTRSSAFIALACSP